MERETDMRVVGVIPARWGSTRLPGKSLLPLCGKPLIHWVVERAVRAARLDELVVATDDARIRDSVLALGVRAVMTSPDHATGTDRIAEALRGEDADVVINIQGDEPLIDPALIDRLADVMGQDDSWDMATAATPIEREEDLVNPSVVKVVWGADGRALYFSRSVIPHVRDRTFSHEGPVHWWHVGIYAYRRAFLEKLVGTPRSFLEEAESLEQLRALHIGGRIAVVTTLEKGMGVDTPEDLAYLERLLRGEADG